MVSMAPGPLPAQLALGKTSRALSKPCLWRPGQKPAIQVFQAPAASLEEGRFRLGPTGPSCQAPSLCLGPWGQAGVGGSTPRQPSRKSHLDTLGVRATGRGQYRAGRGRSVNTVSLALHSLELEGPPRLTSGGHHVCH